MKHVLNLAMIAGLALAATACVHAQSASLLGSGDIKVGLFGPSNSLSRDNAGNTQFAVGADYTFPSLPAAPRPTIYADYDGGSKDGGHVNVAGLGVAAKFSPPIVGSITHITPYAGIGVGVYHTDVKNVKEAVAVSGDDTSIGGKLLAGLSTNRWLVEADYQWVPKTQGVDPSGYSLEIGLKF